MLKILLYYHIDPAHIFQKAGDESESRAVDILLSGHNVEMINLNHNNRLFQKHHVERAPEGPDILVLGSSRSMQISSSLFPGRSFYNASVNFATLEDHLSIFQLYYEKQYMPETVILEITPWMLKKKNKVLLYRVLRDEYIRALERLDLPPELVSAVPVGIGSRKFSELFSPSYFQVCRELRMAESKEAFSFRATDELQAEHTIRFPDGSVEYAAFERNRSEAMLHDIAANFAKAQSVRGYGGYYELDSNLMDLLEVFVVDLKSMGVEVVLYLPPFHPVAYGILMNNAGYLDMVEVSSFIRDLADRHGLRIEGSYDPSVCGLAGTDFVDGHHMTRDAMFKVFTRDAEQ